MYNNPYIQPQFGRYEPQFNQSSSQPIMPQYQQTPPVISKMGLQGKMVDNVDVVKSTDIPLDGSLSIFPLTDGSAIVTKQLQNDGTSKIVVYKPTEEKETKIEYLTKSDLEAYIKELPLEDIEDIKEEIRDLKKEFKGFKKEK